MTCPWVQNIPGKFSIYIQWITSCHLYGTKMSQASTSYTAEKLYEEAYNIQYNWDKILPSDVLEFHTLLSKQTNAPVDLQMGTVLPFVASCMGPKTRGHFLTTLSCLNLFWIVVAASGAGKSQSRKKFITDPLEYILNNGWVKVEDFKISKFTIAGNSIHNNSVLM